MASFKPNTHIQILISEDTEIGRFQDALYFTPEEYEALTDEQIIQMSKERAQNWVESVRLASSQERVEPTKEELEAHALELEGTLAEVQQKINSLEK